MENLFAQFQGADLDRLADCIKAIRRAGLQTSEYTQAGVNQNSGNVWVWDEYWDGAVACTMGFNVVWVYSCPECGEEHEFGKYGDLQEYVHDHDNRCESCVEAKAEA